LPPKDSAPVGFVDAVTSVAVHKAILRMKSCPPSDPAKSHP